MMATPIALQLYTVRDLTAQDFPGTLAQVATIGYAGVELAGYGGMAVPDLKAKLDQLHLRVAGSHVALKRLETELPQVIEECHTLHTAYLVCPVLPQELRSPEGFRALAESLNSIGETAHTNDLTLCYHNHAFEWETEVDGTPAYDWLLDHTDRAYVQFELDIYWLLKAGQDPAEYLAQQAGRMPLVHLKDMTTDERHTYAPVGTGSVQFSPVFTAAEHGGVTWYIVEQDQADGSSIEAARTSYGNLKAMGKV